MHEAMTDIETIKTKLDQAPNCLVVERSGQFDVTKRTHGVPLHRLPDDLVWLIKHYEQIEINSESIRDPRNGWWMRGLDWWPRYTTNDDRGGDPEKYPYFEDVWVLANYAFDGGEHIAIDLHPGPRFGYIGWVTQTDIDYGGGAIVIAKSFFEWLERTLDHGPDAELPYWREKSFKDYAPLIPDDPVLQRKPSQ